MTIVIRPRLLAYQTRVLKPVGSYRDGLTPHAEHVGNPLLSHEKLRIVISNGHTVSKAKYRMVTGRAWIAHRCNGRVGRRRRPTHDVRTVNNTKAAGRNAWRRLCRAMSRCSRWSVTSSIPATRGLSADHPRGFVFVGRTQFGPTTRLATSTLWGKQGSA